MIYEFQDVQRDTKLQTYFKLKKRVRTWRLKRPHGIGKLLQKQYLLVITWNKKHSSKQDVTYIIVKIKYF